MIDLRLGELFIRVSIPLSPAPEGANRMLARRPVKLTVVAPKKPANDRIFPTMSDGRKTTEAISRECSGFSAQVP